MSTMDPITRTRSQHFGPGPSLFRRIASPIKKRRVVTATSAQRQAHSHAQKKRRVVDISAGTTITPPPGRTKSALGPGATATATAAAGPSRYRSNSIIIISSSDSGSDSDSGSGKSDHDPAPGASSRMSTNTTTRGRGRMPLSSELGAQAINRPRPLQAKGKGKGKEKEIPDLNGAGNGTGKGKGKARPQIVVQIRSSQEEEFSPRKRKRGEEAVKLGNAHSDSGSDGVGDGGPRSRSGDVTEEDADEEDEDTEVEDEAMDDRHSDDSSSWVGMEDEAEAEPEFIAENDQHLIDEAPAYALHRLRKAELIRLWKVAGMWNGEDEEDDGIVSGDEEGDNGMSKRDLVDGLVAARKPRSEAALKTSPRESPKRKAALEAAFEMKRLQGQPRTPNSHSSRGRERDASGDVDATPRAMPRTRSKVRNKSDNLLRSNRRLVRGRRNGAPRAGDDRKARFGEEVKSPKKLLNGRLRRSSTLSSAYTTTDNDPETPPPTRLPSRRIRRPAQPRGLTPARAMASSRRRALKGAGAGAGDEDDEEMVEVLESGSASGSGSDPEPDPTPLIQRLRPRTRSSYAAEDDERWSEADADAEDTDEENVFVESPSKADNAGTSRRLRSRDKLFDNDNEDDEEEEGAPPSEGERAKPPPRKTKAKAKASRASRDTDEDMDVDEGDHVEEEHEDEEEDESLPRQPLTRKRSQARVDVPTRTSPPRRLTRRNSRMIASDAEVDQDESMDQDQGSESEESEPEADPTADSSGEGEDASNSPGPGEPAPIARTTRSGRAFGVWQSRRRRLRQEALDDPDMEVEEDAEEDSDTEEEEDESAEADIDLSEATVSSLTRLLRDELVQLCEARGIEVGGTKPQLAKALIEWRDEQNLDQDEDRETSTGTGTGSDSDSDRQANSNPSSQATARPSSSSNESSRKRVKGKTTTAVPARRRHGPATGKILHAVGSNVHVPGKTTPVLLRDHIHATDPATPPHSDDDGERGSDGEGDGKKPAGEAELNLDLQELGLEDSIIRPELLHKLERIGSGGFKDVYVGKYRGRKVAISEFREHLSEMDIRELKLLSEFSHPNIVRFRGICIPEDSTHVPCMLVSELCENGDLFDYIRNVPCPTTKRLLGLMLDIAKGLEYLHTHKPPIIHRDCKSSNILINRQGVAKVGDFGLARVKTSTRSMIRSLVGTVNWQAPELWHPHPRYDYKVDVFSAGVVYWEMMSGWTGEKKYPWEGHNEHYIYDAVGTKQRRPSTAGLRKHWGAEPVNLMERMWQQDPGERPTMTDVVTDLEILYGAA